MTDFEDELQSASILVKEAMKITEWFRKEDFLSFQKEDNSPVTLADYASQIFIISELKRHYPDDQIIAEEDEHTFLDENSKKLIQECYNEIGLKKLIDIKEMLLYKGKSADRKWTVDPIDGTRGYQKGLSYAIGIGFMVQTEPKACAIAVPNYEQSKSAIFIAQKDEGAKKSFNNTRFSSINVSKNNNLRTFRACHSLHYDEPWVLEYARYMGIKEFIQMDSMAKFCLVADGSAELYIKPMRLHRSFSWDFLPGNLLIEEAGGKVTDLNGNNLKYNNEKCVISASGLISSNKLLHDKILEDYSLFQRSQ